MVNETYFYDWMMNNKGLKESVTKTNLARINRINTVYDLFDAYLEDGCAYVLSLFEYSKNDEKKGLLPEHDVAIVGNYYTGTQSLKYALKLYIESMEDDKYFEKWLKAELGKETSYDYPDVLNDAFEEILDSARNLGPINDEQIRKMLMDSEATSSSNQNTKVSTGSILDATPSIVFKGTFQAFLRYIGPFCKNYVNSIAKSARAKHEGICEYCGNKAVLDSAHKDGEDRPLIIQKILENNFKKSENYYEVDILTFEKIFKESHMPVEDHIFFLCKKCHTEYDRGTKISTADILAKRKN